MAMVALDACESRFAKMVLMQAPRHRQGVATLELDAHSPRRAPLGLCALRLFGIGDDGMR